MTRGTLCKIAAYALGLGRGFGNERMHGNPAEKEKTMSNIYRDAIDVQDACNLRAIARLLVKAADLAADAGGTAASYSDPAVVLIVNKIESLVYSNERFSSAYDACKQRSQ